MPNLPSGTVAFLFTDIEGSTVLWERDRAAMATAVDRHLAILDQVVMTQGGVLFKTDRRWHAGRLPDRSPRGCRGDRRAGRAA